MQIFKKVSVKYLFLSMFFLSICFSVDSQYTEISSNDFLIENFENNRYTWQAFDGASITKIVNNSFPDESLRIQGKASDYYAGFVGAWVGDWKYEPYPFFPETSSYNSFKILIDNSNGNVGDRITIQLEDEDGDKFVFTQSLISLGWTEYKFSLDDFTKNNPGEGNGVLEKLWYIGFSLVSVEENGDIDLQIDQIFFSKEIIPNETSEDVNIYNVQLGAYGWGNGVWGNGSGYSAYQFGDDYHHQLTISENQFLGNTGMWIGISVSQDEPAIDLSQYKKIGFYAKSDNEQLKIFLKDVNDKVSAKYPIYNIPLTDYMFYEISINYFASENIDLTAIKEIFFEPALLSSEKQTINIKNIKFINENLEPGILKEPVIEELISKGHLEAYPYSPLTNQSKDYASNLPYLWNTYKHNFIDNYKALVLPGANLEGLVFDPYLGSSTTKIEATDYAKSEGSGYGMLIAIYMNDQEAFNEILDATWQSAMHKKDSSNLFSWNIQSDSAFYNGDDNSASDADQDIALALILADSLVHGGVWSDNGREYDKRAQLLINALWEHTISNNKYLMPSDESGPEGKGFQEVDHETNPSYFSPAWYRIFSMYETQKHDWDSVINWGYQLINDADPDGLGLNPDWCDFWGNNKETEHSFYTYMLGKDAIRLQWRLATDWLWFGEPRAKIWLEKTKSVFSYPGGNGSIVPSEVKPLELDGTYSYLKRGDDYNYTDISYVSMFAAGAMGSDDDSYREAWQEAIDDYMYLANNGLDSFLGKSLSDNEEKVDFNTKYNYYNQSLGLLSLLMLTGSFPNIYTAVGMPTKDPEEDYENPVSILFGWNYLSVVKEGGQKISEIINDLEAYLGSGSILEAAVWDRDTDTFIYKSNLDFDVDYGEAYYIKSFARKVITPEIMLTMPHTYTFKKGWNLFGKPAGSSYSFSELLAEINQIAGKQIAIEIKVYDREQYGGWVNYNLESPNYFNDFIIEDNYRNLGFMIKLTEDFTWTPSKDL